jgi:hypothetical protein
MNQYHGPKNRRNGRTFRVFHKVAHLLHVSHTVYCSRDIGGQGVYELLAHHIDGRRDR